METELLWLWKGKGGKEVKLKVRKSEEVNVIGVQYKHIQNCQKKSPLLSLGHKYQ